MRERWDFWKKERGIHVEESAKKNENQEDTRKEELLTALEKLEFQVKEQKGERDQLLERVKIVKDEYDATISNLMMVKKELNQKKLELDVAQREHKSILEKIKGTRQNQR